MNISEEFGANRHGGKEFHYAYDSVVKLETSTNGLIITIRRNDTGGSESYTLDTRPSRLRDFARAYLASCGEGVTPRLDVRT